MQKVKDTKMEEEITQLSFDGLNQAIENLKKILVKKDLLMDKLMDKIIKQESEVIKVKNQCECNFEVEKIRLENSLELKQLKSENKDLKTKIEQIKNENKSLLGNVRAAHREEIKQIESQTEDEISQLKIELNTQIELKSETSKMEHTQQEIVKKDSEAKKYLRSLPIQPNSEPMSQPSEPKRKRIQPPETSVNKTNSITTLITTASTPSKQQAQFLRSGEGKNTAPTKHRSEFEPNSIRIPLMALRTVSRQVEAYRRLTSKLSFRCYINEIADLQKNLETDIQKSSVIVLQKRNLNNGSGLIPCGHYQQENCKYGKSEHYFSSVSSEVRHHFCVLCMNLRNQTRRHEAANCDMFKMLDIWFKDYAGA